MSLNTAHIQGGGVLINSGESILLYCEHVSLDFNASHASGINGIKNGRMYLTTHRMIFINRSPQDKLQSFSFPFVALRGVDIEQPVFGSNFIKGRVIAQPNGNWEGDAGFKLYFRKGGAIEFGQAILKTVEMTSRYGPIPDIPPPYMPPGQYYQAPPPAYTPPASGYYGWSPPTHIFTEPPPPGFIYMTDVPPAYPGINGSVYNANGYAPPAAAPPGGFAPQPSSAPGARTGDPAQNAYYDPNRPQCAYVPPPAYYQPPPPYQANDKKAQ